MRWVDRALGVFVMGLSAIVFGSHYPFSDLLTFLLILLMTGATFCGGMAIFRSEPLAMLIGLMVSVALAIGGALLEPTKILLLQGLLLACYCLARLRSLQEQHASE